MGRRLRIIFAVVLACLAASRAIGWWLYPADLEAHEAEYSELVDLTLQTMGRPRDFVLDASRAPPRARLLMRRLGVDEIHWYGGNSRHPGAGLYLVRNSIGPLQAMYVYSFEGGPKRLGACYTATPVRGKWYRSHSIGCVFETSSYGD